ncbi:MAG: hypothetical protein FWF92_06240 [Oscillospiraceae bacterium]|nr:hypothetical protein [Oscillospiraceae bacterium]
MKNYHDEVKDKKLPNVKPKKRFSSLPIISLALSLTPVLLLLLGQFSSIFIYIWFVSVWGIGFCLVGIIIIIVFFGKGIKQISKTELIFAIISIISSLSWCLYLFWYYQQGHELFL